MDFVLTLMSVLLGVFLGQIAYSLYCRIIGSDNVVNDISFDECISILSIVINTEIEAFNRDIFMPKKVSLTNNTYQKYLENITKNITDALPNSFYKSMGKYMTPQAVDTYIVRAVSAELKSKVITV